MLKRGEIWQNKVKHMHMCCLLPSCPCAVAPRLLTSAELALRPEKLHTNPSQKKLDAK